MYEINPIERSILTTLLKTGRYLTTSKIAERSKISWNTAEDYLKEMQERRWVKKVKVGRRLYWRAIKNRK